MIERRVSSSRERWLRPLARVVAQLGIKPVAVTGIGLLATLAAAWLVVKGYPLAGGILFVAGSALDMLDGSLARLNQDATLRGELLDSIADRVGETAMWSAIAVAHAGDVTVVAIAVLGLGGSILTSYVRAKAEALGAYRPTGVAGRTERVVLIGVALVSGYLVPFLGLLVALVWLSVGQRTMAAWFEIDDV
jgi:CDP-diacylglycerol--glycerol-3-phosphate 3-phosphatidyltransferase